MPFVTFAERHGFEKGEKKGLEEGLAQGVQQTIELALEFRFPDALPALMPRIRQIYDLDRLQQILQIAKTAPLADIEAALA